MTFPTIPTVAAGRIITGVNANTTQPRVSPNLSGLTKNAGDRLIAICIAYQSSVAGGAAFSGWTAGWTEFKDVGNANNTHIGMAERVSDGTETGTISVTQASTVTGHAVWIIMSIPGAHPTTPSEAGAIANGTTAITDPGALNLAGWGIEDTLWIALAMGGETSTTGSFTGTIGATAPTNYGNKASTALSGDVVGGVDASVAFRELAAASENVGPWSGVDVSNARNSAILIAVRPAPAGNNYTATPSEAVGATDARTITQDNVRTRAEAVGATDARTVTQANMRTRAEAIGVTDSMTAVLSQDADINEDDPVGLLDSSSAVQALVRTRNEPVGVADTAARTLAATRTRADQVGITDTAARAAAYVRAQSDQVGVSDALSVQRTIGLTDQVGTTDSVALARQIALTSPVPVTDEASSQLTGASYTADPADDVGVTDATSLARTKATADSVGLTDATSAVQGFTRAPADQAGLTDATALARTSVLADTVGVTDSLTVVQTQSKSVSDVVGVTGSLTVSGGGQVTDNDPVQVTDAVGVTRIAYRETTDSVGLTDSAQVSHTRELVQSDQAGVTDAVSVVLSAQVSLEDDAGVTDELVLTTGGDAQLDDVAVLSDSVTVVLHRHVEIDELVQASDEAATAALSVVLLQDVVGIRDALPGVGRPDIDYSTAHIVVLEQPLRHLVFYDQLRHVVVTGPAPVHVVVLEDTTHIV